MAVNLTEGERKIISLAWQCFESPPKVDYKKLQQLGGYKTPASATAVYLAARKKMLGGAASGNDTAASTIQKSAAGKKRGSTAADDDSGTGKKRGKETKATTQMAVNNDAEQDDEEAVYANVKAEPTSEGETEDGMLRKGALQNLPNR